MGKIENVQSLNGEAVAINVYKQCDLQIGDVIVNNVNAGTQLDAQQVDALTLPNLVPRACALNVHNDTTIRFVDDFVTNVRTNGVIGYDDCIDTAYSTAYRIDKSSNDNIGSYVEFIIGLLALLIVLAVICYKAMKNCKAKQDEDTNDNDNEQTPLLFKKY